MRYHMESSGSENKGYKLLPSSYFIHAIQTWPKITAEVQQVAKNYPPKGSELMTNFKFNGVSYLVVGDSSCGSTYDHQDAISAALTLQPTRTSKAVD